MPNEEAETLDKYCKEKGHTKAGFIRQAIKDKMARNEQNISEFDMFYFFIINYSSTTVQNTQNFVANIGTTVY